MLLQILMLVGGFVLLIKGADILVSGASSIAANFKVSKMLIGLTIVAFGTCAPELAVSISSLANGTTDMLLGNVFGSNIMNILLLIGIGALICPIIVKRDTVIKEIPILLLISSALVVLYLDMSLANGSHNEITREDAIICLLFFGIFLYYLIAMARKNRAAIDEDEKPEFKLGKSFLLTGLGLIGIIGGSQLVVSGASGIAHGFGISDRLIALTVVALGTSLPELITTITAARRKETDLIVGNIIGSNIFNICIVMGLPVAIFGTITPESFQMIDLVMLIGSAALLLISTRRDRKISRLEGGIMLAIFVAYYGFVIYEGLIA
ncbi:calcium/sodium antiporter [Candidatus Saccharibacteria bacterium]|nr:calcium/sodium antiporter [Candidatus Saccharibacteria bacterium]